MVSPNVINGLALLRRGSFRAAAEVLSSEPPTSTSYALAQGNLAQALIPLGLYPEAEAANKIALDGIGATADECLPPTWVQFFRNRGEILIRLQRRDTALQVLADAARFAIEQLESLELIDAIRKDVDLELANVYNAHASALTHAHEHFDALKMYFRARAIYDSYPGPNHGHAECLTNMAHSYMARGKRIEAELALQEARQLASALGASEQLHRIELAIIKNDSSLMSASEIAASVRNAAADALALDCIETAYIRFGIGAQLLLERTDSDALALAERFVDDAKQLEPGLSGAHSVAAVLTFTEADAAQKRGDVSRAIDALERGAYRWARHYLGMRSLDDLRQLSRDVGDHFRVLARLLLDNRQIDRALYFLELGRAVGHCMLVDGGYARSVLQSAVAASDEQEAAATAIAAVRATVPPGQVALVIAPLPPALVCFIVDASEGTQVVSLPFPHTEVAQTRLMDDSVLIPDRLSRSNNPRSEIPGELLQFGAMIVEAIGVARSVCALVPQAFLHSVPWRGVLRESGLSWQRMPCAIEFNLLLRLANDRVSASVSASQQCIGLGFGSATDGVRTYDFVAEAADFVRHYGGTLLTSCDSTALRYALSQDAIVILSCHGTARKTHGDVRLALSLEDGVALDVETFPSRVRAPVVILSACESGVYLTDRGDYPVGGAPTLLQRGARYCIGARFRIRAPFAQAYIRELSQRTRLSEDLRTAHASVLESLSLQGWDAWRDLSCIELFGGP